MMTQEGRDARERHKLSVLNKENYEQFKQGKCPYCKGTGIILDDYDTGEGYVLDLGDNPIFEVCKVCRGSGNLPAFDTIYPEIKTEDMDRVLHTYPELNDKVRKKLKKLIKGADKNAKNA